MSWRDDVRNVAWETLRGAHGPASGIPAELDALCSPDSEERRRVSLSFLHQGDVYEVTPHVIPHLLSIAEDETVDSDARLEVMEILLVMAAARPPASPGVRFNPFTRRADPAPASRWENLAKWITATHAALNEQTLRMRALAKRPDERLRAVAKKIRAELPG